MRRLSRVLVLAALIAPLSASAAGKVYRPPDALAKAAMSPVRTVAETARDRYRHPVATLRFFGLRPDQTVVEVWPAPGYYTAILAPYLKAHGHYIAAGFPVDAASAPQWQKRAMSAFRKRFPEVDVTRLGPPDDWQLCPPATADRVLTFRNVHNWIAGGFQQRMFDAFYRALKPGGVLGVVEHHGDVGETVGVMKKTGYVSEAYIKALAKNAGFRFVAASSVNANPKDDHHHPAGVWTLPPTLKLGDRDKAKYLAIGESDRMTLKFVKPER